MSTARSKGGWRYEDGKTVYTITILANCTATIVLPGREPESIGAGTY